MPFLVRCLAKEDLLPSIAFIFSRSGCDDAAAAVGAMRTPLLSPTESERVRARVASFRTSHAELPLDEEKLALLHKGVASHHAGMLPLEKALVETLFQVRPTLCSFVLCYAKEDRSRRDYAMLWYDALRCTVTKCVILWHLRLNCSSRRIFCASSSRRKRSRQAPIPAPVPVPVPVV